MVSFLMPSLPFPPLLTQSFLSLLPAPCSLPFPPPPCPSLPLPALPSSSLPFPPPPCPSLPLPALPSPCFHFPTVPFPPLPSRALIASATPLLRVRGREGAGRREHGGARLEPGLLSPGDSPHSNPSLPPFSFRPFPSIPV
ncbi:unnamed protein product [Closterium sp. NIES-53]